MKALVCPQCGSNELKEENGYQICPYCGSKLKRSPSDMSQTSTIALNDDVAMLLQKCRTDPINAKRYANLVLDIDPDNKRALKYL